MGDEFERAIGVGERGVGDDIDDAEDVDGACGGEVLAADEGGADGDAGN